MSAQAGDGALTWWTSLPSVVLRRSEATRSVRVRFCVAVFDRVDDDALRANWRYDCTIATALGYVRQEMSKPASRNLPQPPEGETFPPRS